MVFPFIEVYVGGYAQPTHAGYSLQYGLSNPFSGDGQLIRKAILYKAMAPSNVNVYPYFLFLWNA